MQIGDFYGSHTRQNEFNSNTIRCYKVISIRLVMGDVTKF